MLERGAFSRSWFPLDYERLPGDVPRAGFSRRAVH